MIKAIVRHGAAGLRLRRAQPSESREIRAWIMAHHYLHSAPPGFRVALEFVVGRERVGAMLLGRPASRSYDARRILEVTRIYFIDDTPPMIESRALALMRKHVRIWLPEVRLLLSYSDPAANHLGTIYLADGWAPLGMTRNGHVGWRSRPGRRAETPSRKQRWVRTP